MKYFSNASGWAEGTVNAWFKCGMIDTSSAVQDVYTFSRSQNCGKMALMCIVILSQPKVVKLIVHPYVPHMNETSKLRLM